jgi:hypothetical protein
MRKGKGLILGACTDVHVLVTSDVSNWMNALACKYVFITH